MTILRLFGLELHVSGRVAAAWWLQRDQASMVGPQIEAWTGASTAVTHYTQLPSQFHGIVNCSWLQRLLILVIFFSRDSDLTTSVVRL